MKVAYIIGPYRGDGSEWAVTSNIRRAEAVMLALLLMGYAVHCPHKNTAYLGGALDIEVILTADLAVLERCDLAVLLDGWEWSEGSCREYAHATQRGVRVFRWEDDQDKLRHFAHHHWGV